MRRLLLPFLLVAAAASPASAYRDGFLCAGANVWSPYVVLGDSREVCVFEDYRYRIYCSNDYVAVEPDVAVETWACVPAG